MGESIVVVSSSSTSSISIHRVEVRGAVLSRTKVGRGIKCALSVRVDFEFASMKYLFSLRSLFHINKCDVKDPKFKAFLKNVLGAKMF